MKLKQVIKQYRNIGGKTFIQLTSDPSEFEKCKKECKEQGLAFRIINNQFYYQINK